MRTGNTFPLILAAAIFIYLTTPAAFGNPSTDPSDQARTRQLLSELEQTQSQLAGYADSQLNQALNLKQQIMEMSRQITELKKIVNAESAVESVPETQGVNENTGNSAIMDLSVLVILVVLLLVIIIYLRNRRSVKENEELSRELENNWSSEDKDIDTDKV